MYIYTHMHQSLLTVHLKWSGWIWSFLINIGMKFWSCRESLVTSRCSRFLCRGYVKPFDMKVTISEIIDGLVRCTKGGGSSHPFKWALRNLTIDYRYIDCSCITYLAPLVYPWAHLWPDSFFHESRQLPNLMKRYHMPMYHDASPEIPTKI